MRKRGTVLILLGFAFLAAAVVLVMHNRQEQEQAETAAAEVMEVLRQEITPVTGETPAAADDPAAPEDGSAESGPEPAEKETETSENDIVYPDYVLDPGRAMPEIGIDGYRYIGYLEVPSVGLDQPVQSEWSYPNLQISACRYFGSVYTNNMVVCGHNYFPGFGLLSNVAAGDPVRFIDVDGNVFNYQVAGVELLSPDETMRMIENEWDLTLFTCTMSTVSRVTVRCTAVP